MAGVKVVETVNASADRVWELFRDFGGIARISPGIQSCSVEGQGIGAVRTLKMGGLELRERLEAFDDAGRSLCYAIIGDHPLPFDNYLSTVRVVDQGAITGGDQAPRTTTTFEDVGIILEVTPHVTASGQVLMKLHAENSAVREASADLGYSFTTQEADNQIGRAHV